MWGKITDKGISVYEQAMQELVMSERIIKGRTPKPSMIIIDSKSIKNTDVAEEKGYDAGKKLQA